MCERCNQIDRTTNRLRRLLDLALDPVTIQNMREGITELEAEKAHLKCSNADYTSGSLIKKPRI